MMLEEEGKQVAMALSSSSQLGSVDRPLVSGSPEFEQPVQAEGNLGSGGTVLRVTNARVHTTEQGFDIWFRIHAQKSTNDAAVQTE